jgi:NTE family protein
MVELGASSKLIAEWEFLSMLRAEGRARMDAFLKDHAADLGTRSTFEIDSLLDTILEQV